MAVSFNLLLIISSMLFAVSQCELWMTAYDRNFTFTCADGQVLNSLESDHDNGKEDRVFNFYCASPPQDTTLQECEWSDYANDFDGLLSFQCSNESAISGVGSYHDNKKEDRRYKFRCCKIQDGFVAHGCSFTQWANTYDHSLSYKAPDGMIIKGVLSPHDNGKEDRVFKFEICSLDKLTEGAVIG